MTLIFIMWQDETKAVGSTTDALLHLEKGANIVCLHRGKYVPP
jgi:hypothetical protein